MKKITIEITFDDTDGYKGHGDDTCKVIKDSIEREIKIGLEGDGVVKPGWEIKAVDNNGVKTWLQKRIKEEQEKYEDSCDVVDKASKGGQKKAYHNVLEYLKKH